MSSAPIFNGYAGRNLLRIFKSLFHCGLFSCEDFVDFVKAIDANDAREVAVSDATRAHSREPVALRPYLQPIDTTWKRPVRHPTQVLGTGTGKRSQSRHAQSATTVGRGPGAPTAYNPI